MGRQLRSGRLNMVCFPSGAGSDRGSPIADVGRTDSRCCCRTPLPYADLRGLPHRLYLAWRDDRQPVRCRAFTAFNEATALIELILLLLPQTGNHAGDRAAVVRLTYWMAQSAPLVHRPRQQTSSDIRTHPDSEVDGQSQSSPAQTGCV